MENPHRLSLPIIEGKVDTERLEAKEDSPRLEIASSLQQATRDELIGSLDTLMKAVNSPESLTDDNLLELLSGNQIHEHLALLQQQKEALVGKEVLVRGSIEISNRCRLSCNYCGMSKANEGLERFRLDTDTIKERIQMAKDIGIDLIHISSAEDNDFPVSDICDIISFAKGMGIEIVLVLGMKSKQEYQEMFDAGARKYTIKIESSDPAVFRQATNYSLEKRKASISRAKEAGFEIGSGVIVGLPCQTMQTLVGDLRFLQDLKPVSASASVFTPNAEANFRGVPMGNADVALRMNVLMRMLLRVPAVRIPASSSFGADQKVLLQTAANVVSINLTPEEFAQQYSMYGGRERLISSAKKIKTLVEDSGLITNLTL